MNTIKKIKLINFKRFPSFEVSLDPDLNLFIGDNEAGKSTILTAIDLAISGSRNKVEGLGLEHLFNSESIEIFLKSNRSLNDLPSMIVELYFDSGDEFTDGKNNTEKRECHGIRLTCKPSPEYSKMISDILKDQNCIFPFEFYSIEFATFAGNSFNSYSRCIKHVLVDNSQISSEYAMREYTKEIYNTSILELTEKYKHQHEYRLAKNEFRNNSLKALNERLLTNGEYTFGLKSNSKFNLETDLTIYEGSITIDNKGKGQQCLIKTELALSRKSRDLKVVLLEEPENHLSYLNTQRLIQRIAQSENKQIFIATHSDMISARLDLRKCILVNCNSDHPLKLSNLPDATAKFFMKAPDKNILQFILSKKMVLVEGDAEYILAEEFFRKATGRQLKSSGVGIISVDGTSFKRYLDIAIKLKIRTAVITDNDGNYQAKVVDKYASYSSEECIKIFSDANDVRSTFEICTYQDNQVTCDDLFKKARKTLTVQDYMLSEKAECAFQLLDKKAAEIQPPKYIEDAFQWIIKD